jgi:hypothetical protein
MTECVILFRRSSGSVDFVGTGDDPMGIAVFPDHGDAEAYVQRSGYLQALGRYQIVEATEL